MIWVTWRQHRTQAIVCLGVFCVVAIFAIATGAWMRSAFDADGLGACLARSGGSGCPAVITSFVHRFDGPAAITANLPLFVIPGLVGVVVRHGDQLIVTYIPAGRPVLDAAAHRGRAIPRHRRRGARHGRLAAPSAYHLTPAG